MVGQGARIRLPLTLPAPRAAKKRVGHTMVVGTSAWSQIQNHSRPTLVTSLGAAHQATVAHVFGIVFGKHPYLLLQV